MTTETDIYTMRNPQGLIDLCLKHSSVKYLSEDYCEWVAYMNAAHESQTPTAQCVIGVAEYSWANPELDRATDALQTMYDEWNDNGGISPDTRDEIAVVAKALGMDETAAHIAATVGPLDTLADQADAVAQTGAELDAIAAVIVPGLKAWAATL